MASSFYTRGTFQMGRTGASGTDLEADAITTLLVNDNEVFAVADNTIIDVSGNEVSGGSYARQVLAGKSFTEDDGGTRSFFDATDAVFPGVPTQSPDLINAVIVADDTNAGDTNKDLLSYNDFTAIQGNGSDITVQWAAAGILELDIA